MPKSPKEKVAVIGLGYVGLPLSVLLAEKGYKVYGIDHNSRRVKALNKGINTLKDEPSIEASISKKIITATTSYEATRLAKKIIICVPTPVDDSYVPDLTPIIKATKGIAKFLRRGQMIILESTVNPGVCEEIVLPILESTGLKAGKDFDLVHCPERINPGDPKWHTGNIPRCVGATTKRGAQAAAKFYRSFITGQIRVMKSLKEAEATKIVENSFRDVNIAFVNELAKSFDKLGIDVHDVIQGAATKPFAFLAHYPSIGVGGHCIPVDPYYLIERAWQAGFDHKFLRLAREINNSMPFYAVRAIQLSLNKLKLPVKGTAVGVLGLSYKANIGDLRESPTLKAIEHLEHLEADVHVYDPYVIDQSTEKNLDDLLKKVDVLLLATNHQEYIAMDIKKLKKYRIKIVIDGKNCLDKEGIEKLGIVYKGIGR